MNSLKTTIMILLIPLICFSYDWQLIGPDSISVNDYLCSWQGDLLCVPNGIYKQSWEGGHYNWKHYSSGNLPVLQVEHYDTSGVLVILNGDTPSDGIYEFRFKSGEFELLHLCYKPNFLHYYYYPQSQYYCGYQEGLLVSTDGVDWQEVEYFKDKIVMAMATMGSNCLVTDSSNIYFSSDHAANWEICCPAPPNTRNICWDQQGKAYLIYPGQSRSSGLWSSADSGKTWQPVFWAMNMSALFYVPDNFFVGWRWFFGQNGGVAIWKDEQGYPYYMNEGLPETSINRITENDMVDCLNAVVCTGSGAYWTCDFTVGINDKEDYPKGYYLSQNYPNPFNPITNIRYSIPLASFVSLMVYNTIGQLITILVNEQKNIGSYQVTWDASNLGSGVYYYILKAGDFTEVKKSVLIK
jgi:hypothetical protein